MDARFDLYEHVRISSPESSHSDLAGRYGVVLGRTETSEGDSWYYTIIVDGEAEAWCLFEWELEATGRQFARGDFYDGSSLRVKVDESSKGFIDLDKTND